MPRRLGLLVAVVLTLAAPACARAATYYVSPSGSDSAAGTSPATAWNSVGRVNRASLSAGDGVLFEGGARFADTDLEPSASGVTFSSYGSGQANLPQGIWFASRSNLVFDNLAVDTGLSNPPDGAGLQASASGSGSTDITIRNCTFRHLRYGILVSNRDDARWTIQGSTIQYTRDSGAI